MCEMFNFELFVDFTLIVVNQQISLSTSGDGCVYRWWRYVVDLEIPGMSVLQA